MMEKWLKGTSVKGAATIFWAFLALRLTAAPIITVQPLNQVLNLGGLLNLGVTAIAGPEVRYQWRLNGDNVPGATNSTYTVLGLGVGNAGSYTVLVYDHTGVAVSQPALVNLAGLLQLSASDSFAGRGGVLNLLNLISYSNVGATSDPGEPLHAGIPGGKSVWFTWTPLLSGVVSFSTAGSSFDTLLAVYTGTDLTNLTEVVSDDDSDGFYTSKVTFNAVAGTAYQIAVDGAYGAEGNIILSSTFDLLGPASPRISLPLTNQIVQFGDSAQFSVNATGAGLSYQWYFNGAPLSGATAATLLITNVGFAQVGQYNVRVTSGSRNIVSAPGGLQISTLDGALNVNGVARDKFQAAVTALLALNSVASPKTSGFGKSSLMTKMSSGGNSRGYTGTQVFSTYAGGTQPGEPSHCDTPGGASSWVTVVGADNGVMTMGTDGSNFKAIMGVYTGNGNDFSTLTPVDCAVGTGTGSGQNAHFSFNATSNTTYYVGVDGVSGAYGTVMLNWNLGVPPAITSQPSSRTVSPGTTVTLSASASGYPTPSCQWWCNGWPMAGATNWSLTITNFQAAKQGVYQMVAGNTNGAAATTPTSILLNSPMRLDSFGINPASHLCEVRLIGVVNTNYIIQASTNFTSWVSLATNNSTSGLWTFTDSQSTNYSKRFYRGVVK